MRIIKFRAWDKEEKTMIYPDVKTNDETAKYTLNAWCDSESDATVLMQFTGLTDKNGNEIYEDDIVNLILNCKIIHTEKIVFSDGAFCIENFYDGIFYVPFHYYIEDEKKYEFEVIGNIHDNPELL